MSRFRYLVVVECETPEQATRVMIDRIGPDEDYGFDYHVDIVDGPIVEDDDRLYDIVRYRFDDDDEVLYTGVTLDEAQAHCHNPQTKGDGWFDGYRDSVK